MTQPRRLGVIVLVVAVLAVTLWQLRGWQQRGAESDRRDSAVSVAARVAGGFTGLSAQGSKDALATLSKDLSPTLRKQLTEGDSAVAQVLTSSKVSSSSEVVLAGLVSEADTKASALVAVTAMVRNSTVPKGEKRLYRFHVTLIRDGGHWLADSLELVP